MKTTPTIALAAYGPALRRLWSTAQAVCVVAGAGLVAGCVDVREASGPATHPESWNTTTSEDFHGRRVASEGVRACERCHGVSLAGEGRVPGCFTCHEGPGGHPGGYAAPNGGASFHGDDVAAHGPAGCGTCHGTDYLGGWTEVSCFRCHAGGPSGHPDGWMDPASLSFHGLRVLTNGYLACRACHGAGLDGGTSGRACAECHE